MVRPQGTIKGFFALSVVFFVFNATQHNYGYKHFKYNALDGGQRV
jgi:hypothetical protein